MGIQHSEYSYYISATCECYVFKLIAGEQHWSRLKVGNDTHNTVSWWVEGNSVKGMINITVE